MSECRYLYCDGCGATLHLPTNPDVAGRWELISRTIYGNGKPIHRDMHWCGECDGREQIIKRLESVDRL